MSVNNLSTGNIRIWEAARATSAASTFFDPIQIGTQWYVDGATGMNNPVDIVLAETKAVWPDDARDKIQCLVSIGTGVPGLKNFGDNLLQIKDTLKALSTETERTEERFYKNHGELGVGGRYFRFNVDSGMSDVALDEQDKKDQIVAATELYLERERVKVLVSAFLKAKAPQSGSVSAMMKNTYLEWLPYIDTHQQHNEARSHRKSEETGNWFLDGPFRQWKAEPGSFMWLHAKAGSGKTVLCSTIIDQLEEQKLGRLAFFYLSFQSSDGELVDLWHLKCSLLVQFLKSAIRPDPSDPTFFLVPTAFRALYNKYRPSNRPKMEDLDAAFWEILSLSRTAYFVVDGLDEYPRARRRDILAFLGDISLRFRSSAHIMVTSRDEPDIAAAVGEVPAPQLVVHFDKDIINNDIRRHLDVLLKTDQSFGAWSVELKGVVVNQLTDQADGVFRWADLQIRALAGKEREKDIRRALKKLPRGLEKTYERMLRRIEDADESDEAVLILSWLACAKRPLSLAEVAELAAFEVADDDASSSDDDNNLAAGTRNTSQGLSVIFDPSARFVNHDSLRRILAGLVTFTESSQFALWDGADPPATRTIVAFAHFSVKQYLQSDSVSPSNFRLKTDDCDRLVFKCCLAYMDHYDITACDVRTGTRTFHPPYPLLLYAWQNTWSHASSGYPGRSAGTRRRPTQDREEDSTIPLGLLISQQAQSRGTSFMFSVGYAGWKATGGGMDESKLAQDVTRGYASDLAGIAVNLQESSSAWAPVFMCLPRVESADRSVAHSIAALGDPTLIQILLDIGINVEMTNPNSSYSSLVHALAVGERYLAEYLNLLEEGYTLSRSRDRPSIHEALGLLLDAGCAVDALDSNSLTPLHWAAWAGDVASIKCLLKHYQNQQDDNPHLDLNRQDFSGKSPFFVAVTMGHLDAAKALLEVPPCKINLADFRQRTPLIQAACRRGKAGVEFLLSRPEVEVNRRDALGRTALFWAVWGGDVDIVHKILADPTIETSEVNSEGWNLLICAAERGHDAIVQILLLRSEFDINVNLPDMQGRTALAWAAFRGHEATVRLLLQHQRVRVNIKDRLGLSPLDWAVFRGNEKVVGLLAAHHVGEKQLGRIPPSFAIRSLDVKLKQQLSFPARRQPDEVWRTAFSNDGRRLAISGQTGFVDIWDIGRETVTTTLETPFSPLTSVRAVVWSPDDSMMVTCTDGGAFLWDAESGRFLRKICLGMWAASCAWSPDGKWFIVGFDDTALSLWQEFVETDDSLHHVANSDNLRPWLQKIVQGPISAVAISSDGKRLVIIDGQDLVKVYDIPSRALEYRRRMSSRPLGMCLGKDARHLLVLCSGGELLLFEIATMQVVSRYAGAIAGQYWLTCGFGGGTLGEIFVLCGSEGE